MAHDVFISYSSKDKTVADAVCAKLEEKKIRCWIAPRDIPAGKNFARSIIDAINTSKIFVLVWSSHTNTSEHILNEINQAFDQGITIIPFRIQDVQPTMEMRYYFGRTHWLDALTPPLEKHIETLARAILLNLGLNPEIDVEPSDGKVEPAHGPQEQSKDETETGKKKENKPSIAQSYEIIEKETQDVGKRVEKLHPQVGIPGEKKLLIPISAFVLIAVVVVLLFLFGPLKGLSAARKSTLSPSETLLVLPSSTNTSIQFTETATPSIKTATPSPAWVNNFSEPILGALKEQTPFFQDDFSKATYFWSFGFGDKCDPATNSGIISNGKLQLNTAGCFTKGSLGYIYLDNFVTQFEIDLRQINNESTVKVDFGNKDTLYLTGKGNWSSMNCRLGDCYNRSGGTIPYSDIETDTIIYISYSTKNAIYINGIPIYYFTDSDQDPGQLSFEIHSMGDEDMNSVSLNYLKIWDLDMVENMSEILK